MAQPSLALLEGSIFSAAVTWWRRLRDKCGTRDGWPSLLSVLDLRFAVA